MMPSKVRFSWFLAALLVFSGSLVSVAGASSLDCSQADEPNRTFAVTIRALDDVYRIGDDAKLRVRVTRVIGGKDLGPVEGADVLVAISLGDVNLYGGGVTDEDGRASVKVRLKRYASTGVADVYASATKRTADIPCHSELEYERGEVEVDGLFRVVR